jgi:signal transduction histidine kinase
MFECASEAAFCHMGPAQTSPEYQPDGSPSADKALKAIETALRDGSNYFEWTHERRNGEKFAATVLLTRMKLDGKMHLQATVRDITERKKAEAELAEQAIQLEKALRETQESKALILRNDKLASLGRMSAGLIHEINNPLNYAKQGVYLLRRTSQDNLPEESREDFLDILNDIEEGVTRAVTIISDLRDFTRVTYDHSQTLELEPLVKKSLRFFAHEFKDRVNLEIEVPEGIEICGNSNHLVQVLINLLQNALDSVNAKSYEEGSAPCVSVTATPGDQEILRRVQDNGPGISAKHMDNIFDPFYTTKDVGKGTGLGLAICHRIMKEHGGGIEVYSEPEGSCEFTLTFPPVDSSASAAQDQPTGEAAPTGSVENEA